MKFIMKMLKVQDDKRHTSILFTFHEPDFGVTATSFCNGN